MECLKVNNLIVDYIDDNLNSVLKVEIKKHLDTCSSCKTEYDQMQALLQDMSVMNDHKPGFELRDKFMAMLENEKESQNIVPLHEKKTFEGGIISILTSRWGQIGVSAAILVIGFFLGFVIKFGPENGDDMQLLRSEIDIMKQIMLLSKLGESSASERIQAVGFIKEQEAPDEEMITTLINTMNNDRNINVRIAAATALSGFYHHDRVKEALVNSLKKQEDPMMQITLINMLVEIQDERAIESLQYIANDEESHEVVRSQAEKGLRAFI